MIRHATYQVDNRDASQMYEYLEARIEALKRRIAELEAENESLRWNQFAAEYAECAKEFAASA